MTATNDGIIHLKGRIRDGKLVALLDHEGKELGAPVTALESVTGGNRISAAGKTLVQDDAIDTGAGLGRFTSTTTAAISNGLIKTLRSNIITATDTVTAFELDALRYPLARLMRSSVWKKLKVLWVPVGTDATKGALVPIIGSNFSAINLVAGDYSSYSGITGNGTNKAINTNYNPDAVAGDWGAGAFLTSLTESGVAFGTLSGTNTFCGLAPNGANINNKTIGAQEQYPGLNIVQTNGTVGQAMTGGYEQFSAAMTGAVAPNSPLTLLSVNGAFYSTQSICGFAAWAPSATPQELRELSIFFRNANMRLGRLVCQPSLVVDGDSNTVGYGLASPATMRFSKKLADAIYLTEDNQGLNGSAMSDDDNGGASASWVTDHKISKSAARAPTALVVALSTNDDQTAVPLDAFKADYLTWLGYQYLVGVDPAQMILMSPVAAFNATADQVRLLALTNIIAGIANDIGALFVDVYTLTLGRADYFQPDKIHLSESGHVAIKDEVLRVISLSKSEGPLYRATFSQ